MNKIRRWFNKPKKEVENQRIQPLPSEKKCQACHDVTQDLRILGGSSTSRTKTDGSDPDVILTARLSMLRELLQGHISQEHDFADVQPQNDCPTTETSAAPVWTSLLQAGQVGQVGQVTGKGMKMELTDTRTCDIISLSPAGGRASDTSHGLCLLKRRDGCSLPSSPCLGGKRKRLPCSLPCSPLLGGRRWRSPSSSPCPPSGLSRFWVEEALQRSKKLHLPPSCPPQVRQEGEEDRRRETEEEGEEEKWSDEDKEVKIIGIRLSDTVIFRPLSPPRVCGKEEEEEDEDVLCVNSDMWTSCQLMPCICLRCPSAPPYEADVFSPGHILSVSENQQHRQEQTQLSHRTDIQGTEGDSKQSSLRDGAPQLGDSSRLYPSLSLWTTAADTQIELNRKQEEEVNTIHSCFYGNSSDDHLLRLCDVISGIPGEQQSLFPADLSFILKKVFAVTTCSKRTARPVESCSFCSQKLTVEPMKHLCTTCEQVFCGRCLCHFLSLHQIHQWSQTAAD